MTIDNLPGIVIVAIVVISSIVSALRRAKKALGDQPLSPAATAARDQARAQRIEALARATGQESALQQRAAQMRAEMQRRGITPPPGMQAIFAALGNAPAPLAAAAPPVQQQPAPAAPPVPAPQAQRQAHRHRPASSDPIAPVAPRPVPAARPTDLLTAFDDEASPAAGASTRRMLAGAFGDPAHARDAVILAEVLAAPVALR
ncbi:MAG TPA: hypothetical protein VGD01_02895 [Candidatus Elarobacter sp.]